MKGYQTRIGAIVDRPYFNSVNYSTRLLPFSWPFWLRE